MESIVEQCTSSEEQKNRVLKTRADPEDFDCYKQAVKTLSKTCYNLGQVMKTPPPLLLFRGVLMI